MDRRKTLGSVRPAVLNRRHTSFEGSLRQSTKPTRSRKSMAPPAASKRSTRRQTMAGGRTSSIGARSANVRKSMGGGRKSMGGGRKSMGRTSMAVKKKNADPRPIKKKSFMEQEVKEVILCLCRRQYDHPITPKQLTKPTAKDFENIAMFLFSIVDPKYRGGSIKSDFPLFYKGLGYPFTISPAALCAVGAPNTWPSMLAALSWLVELLSYDEVVSLADDNEDAQHEDQDHSDKIFFGFLQKQYIAYLSGDDAAFEKHTEDMEKYFSARNDALKAEVKTATEQSLLLQDELKSLTEADSMIPSLREQVASLEGDITKYTNYLTELGAYKDKKKKTLNEAKDSLREKEQHLHELQLKKQRLEKTIANQAFSVQEFQNMRTECSRKRKALLAVQKEKADAQAEIWDMETRRGPQIEELEQLTKEYNRFAEQLQMCPSTAKYADGKDFSAKLHVFDDAKSLVSVDIKGVVKPHVKQLIETVTHDAVQVGADSLKLQQRIDELSERRDEVTATNKSLKATLDRQENALTEQKERLANGTADLQKKIDDLRIATTKLTSADVAQRREILAQRQQLQGLQQERLNAMDAAKAEEEQLYQQMHRAVQLVANHEEHQQATLKSFAASLESSLQSIQ